MVQHHYTKEQWLKLSEDDKAMCVAYSRLNHLIEGHRQDALNTWMRRQRNRR